MRLHSTHLASQAMRRMHFVSRLEHLQTKAEASSSRSREVVSPLEYQSVEEWLTSIKMQKYTDNFLESDHTTVTSCLELTADDLTK